MHLVIIPAIVIVTAVLGSLQTSAGMVWYRKLKLPPWTPPGKLIGLVWTILYLLGTVSAIVFWQEAPRGGGFLLTLVFFLANVFLNVLWSYLFFSLHRMEAAFYDALALAFTILVLIIFLLPVSPLAWAPLVPYLLWSSFAAYLTYKVSGLNRKK